MLKHRHTNKDIYMTDPSLRQEKTTESKYPTALFWNRLGLAVMILFTLIGIGTCRALDPVRVQAEEVYTSPTVAPNLT